MLTNMASILVGAVFIEDHVVLANVGDSRVYRLRHAFRKQVTNGHVLHREGLESLSPLQLLTRAVGLSASVEPAS